MAVNTSVYGEPATWNRMPNVNFADPNMNYYYANFGDQSSYDSSFLQAGVDNGKISLNTPLDKSLSWCGLGSNSTFSNLECYNNKHWQDSNDPFKMINKDSRTVTNFAIFGKVATGGPVTSKVSSWFYSDTTSTSYASRARWSPEAITGTSSSTRNYNMGLRPIVQIPMRNCILVPFVECVSSIDTVITETHIVPMWDYLNGETSYNYTNCPYILHVTMQAWGHIDDNSVSNARTNRWVATEEPHIAVLDETDACKNQPYNTLVPGYTQSGTYQYYAMGGKGIMIIMGTLSTNNTYILLPHSNGYETQTKGNLVLPHPNGQLKYLLNTSTAVSAADRVLYYVEYYDNGEDDNFQEWVRRQIACFGLFFTDDEQTAKYGDFDDEKMFLGTLDSNLIGNGDYTHGSDNRSQPQWSWATTNQSPYVPQESGGSGDDPYSDANHYLEAHAYSRGGKIFGTSDAGKWVNLLSEINDIDIHEDGFNDSVFYGQEPLDCLIEGKLVFVNDLLGAVNVTQNANIELGKHETQVTATKIRATYPETVDCGDITINGVYNDFRDFEPYTSINLLLPFAGSIELPPAVAMYHNVHLYETIDLLTGDLFYTIHIDNIEFGRAYGNCALELSKNGYAVSQYAQMRYSLHEQSRRSYFNAAASLLGGMSGTGIAASYGNVAGVVTQSLGGLANAANSFIDGLNTGMYNRHTAPPVASSDKVSSCVEYGRCIVPAIVVTSPRMIKDYTDSNYKAQTGFATYKVGKIKDESGPVVCDSVNPSGLTCSAEEKRMIIEHLKQGIYIK